MQISPKADEILFLPVGGSGEIGSNLNLYGAAGKWLAVDCGVSFGDKSTPGIEVVMPDPAFIAERAKDLVGLVITHGHEDHIGAIEYLWDRLQCPVYATPFTAALIRAKLGDYASKSRVRIIEKNPGERWQLGPFTLEYIHVTHSIPNSAMLVIETDVGRILHTGDWKFDPAPLIDEPSDKARLQKLSDEGVLAVVGDSTNATVPGRTGSENDVRIGLIDVVKQHKKGRVAIACFASNVARLVIAHEAARASGREIAFVGRSLWRALDAAQGTGYWNLPEPLEPEDAGYLPSERALYVVTGSQGEERSALARLAQNEHPELVLEKGDTVIFSSRDIPGNEKEIARVQNKLAQMGVKVITVDDAPVHVSGHPAQDELVELYQMVRPQILIPVHGELRHQQAHVKVAESCQVMQHHIPENGHVIRITKEGVEKIGEIEIGRLGIDGKRLVPLRSDALRARIKMGSLGAMVITLVIDRQGKLATAPEFTVIGLSDDGADALPEDMEDELQALIENSYNKLSKDSREDDELVESAIYTAARRLIKDEFGKKPVTRIQIVRL